MTLYTWTDADLLDVAEIDIQHRELARLSEVMAEQYRTKATRQEIFPVFRQFRDVLLRHFLDEEAILARLPPSPDLRLHVTAHKQNHQRFRDMMEYATGKFEEEPERPDPPAVVPLIPEKYFHELKDMDKDMKDFIHAAEDGR